MADHQVVPHDEWLKARIAFLAKENDQLAAYRRRMGWTFKWLSSFGNDFNYDYFVSFTPEQVAAKQDEEGHDDPQFWVRLHDE